MEINLPPSVATLFTGDEVLGVPSIANRHGYKKESGSEDTNNEKDVIKT